MIANMVVVQVKVLLFINIRWVNKEECVRAQFSSHLLREFDAILMVNSDSSVIPLDATYALKEFSLIVPGVKGPFAVLAFASDYSPADNAGAICTVEKEGSESQIN